MRKLLIILALGAAFLAPASAGSSPETNANVKRATRKPKKFKPPKYKAPKHKKAAHVKYGAN